MLHWSGDQLVNGEMSMTTDNLTLMQATIQKMRWNEVRQKVLSQNIANADTPGYKPQDIDLF